MVFDVWDDAVLTESITRSVQTRLEQINRIGNTIAPLVGVNDRSIKLDIMEVAAAGKGRFKAEDATPPIFIPKVRFTEEAIDLADLAEMTPIKPSLLQRLESRDPRVRARAGASIVARGRTLQLRNEVLSEWMVWQALLTGQLPIEFEETGANYVLDFQIPGTHFVSPSTAWTNRGASTPITNLLAWQDLLADDAGVEPGCTIILNSKTWRELRYNTEVKNYLTGASRQLLLPSQEDITGLLNAGTRWVIHDGGYRAEAAGYSRGRTSLTKWVPDGKVILLPNDYQVDGERVIDVPDGLVPVIRNWDTPPDFERGPRSQIIVDQKSGVTFIKQQSSRIVRMRHPEAIIVATVF